MLFYSSIETQVTDSEHTCIDHPGYLQELEMTSEAHAARNRQSSHQERTGQYINMQLVLEDDWEIDPPYKKKLSVDTFLLNSFLQQEGINVILAPSSTCLCPTSIHKKNICLNSYP